MTNDPPEVCPFARGANLEPYPVHYRPAFAFSGVLCGSLSLLPERFTGLPRFVSAPL